LTQYTQDLELAKEAQERHVQRLTELVEQLSLAQQKAEAATRAKSEERYALAVNGANDGL
jgi:hypothetical protein